MTREEELEALFPKMAILTSKSLTVSSLLLYSMHWTFLTIDDPLWGSNIFFSEGSCPPVVNIQWARLEIKLEQNYLGKIFEKLALIGSERLTLSF